MAVEIDQTINLNALPWRTSRFRQPGFSFSRSGDGKVYAEAFPNPLWEASLLSSQVSKRSGTITYQRWIAILETLRNDAVGISMYDVEHQAPSLPFTATALTVGTINSDRSGFTLAGTGLTSADRLGAGDFLEVTVDTSTGERYLHKIRRDWTYGATTEISLVPKVNTAISNGDTVVVRRPRGNFLITEIATPDGNLVTEGRIGLTLVGAI